MKPDANASSGAADREAGPYDPETLAELAQTFGPERLTQLLAGLDEEIARRLDGVDRDRLGHDAHALVSVSGTLGFEPLSRACAALEQACLAGEDVTEPLSGAREAAAQARRAIAALGSGSR